VRLLKQCALWYEGASEHEAGGVRIDRRLESNIREEAAMSNGGQGPEATWTAGAERDRLTRSLKPRLKKRVTAIPTDLGLELPLHGGGDL
jgi:hypothetical protein